MDNLISLVGLFLASIDENFILYPLNPRSNIWHELSILPLFINIKHFIFFQTFLVC